MENKQPSNKIKSENEGTNKVLATSEMSESSTFTKKDSDILTNPEASSVSNKETPPIPKKPVKPPKLEDKPFREFISEHLIPGLKSSIQNKGIVVQEIKLIQGTRPVVGGNCWIVYCEIAQQRRFWLCFNKELITSDKTILLAESNSDPSIVESFLIDEKKTTLPLLISRVLQRLNGQKWIGSN